MAKVRFSHPLAGAPLVGLQFTIAPFPQNGGGGLAATANVGAAVSMRLIADPSDWDKTQHGITLGESGLPAYRSLERSTCRLAGRDATRVPFQRSSHRRRNQDHNDPGA